MKKINYLIFITIFNFCITTAQTVSTLFETNSNSMGLTIDGNYLYASSTFTGKVHKIDILQDNVFQTYNTITNGSQTSQNGICKFGNYILVARGAQNKIIKFAPDDVNITVEDVISVSSPNGIAIRNSELYISSTNKIYNVDLSSTAPALIQIASNVQAISYWTSGTVGLKIYDNYLYVAENNGISKINLNSGNYEKELITSYTGSSFTRGSDANTFYFTSTNGTNQIYELNLATQTYSILLSLDSSNYPNTYDISYANGSLFVTCLEGSKIAEIELNLLDIKDIQKDLISLYPNPTSNYCILKGIEPNEEITVINMNGKILKSFKLTDEKFDVSDLEAGIYLIKSKNRYKRFIKK